MFCQGEGMSTGSSLNWVLLVMQSGLLNLTSQEILGMISHIFNFVMTYGMTSQCEQYHQTTEVEETI
jgi:hypothetical protein